MDIWTELGSSLEVTFLDLETVRLEAELCNSYYQTDRNKEALIDTSFLEAMRREEAMR